ncbi:MAG: HupE/UreJ family protein [Sandaracinus sp.]
MRAFFVALLVIGLFPGDASAHRGSATYLIVEPTEGGANVTADLEIVDAAMELGLGEDAAEEAVLAQAERVRAWIARGIWLEGEGGRCESTLDSITRAQSDDAPRLEIVIHYRCPAPARALVLHDDTIFASDAQHETFVRERFGTGTETRVLRVGRQTAPLGEPASMGSLLGQFAWEGVMHLLTGYDHLLFLLSLLLTTGELAAKQGQRAALKDIGFVVTAFTLGHSVTLIIAALGVLVLPARLVESVIAGSIVVVAVMNIARPESRKQMPWLALGFGLIHGFGFSSVLADLGLPSRARVLSLLAFNVGIELAQLGCVLLAIVPLEWMAKQKGYRAWVVRGGSVCIALLAGFWMIERALGLG